MLFRQVRVIALLLGLIMVLTACSGSPKPADSAAKPADSAKPAAPVKLSFMGWGQPSEQKVFQTLIDKYQKANPNVTVDYVNVPPGEFLQKLSTLAAADDMPDAFYMNDEWVGEWASKGLLAQIDKYVDKAEVAKVWPRATALYAYDGKQVGKGPLYALPKDLGPFVMVYNKDLFDKYGVPYPKTDGSFTWDDYLAAAQKLTKKKADGTYESYGVGSLELESAIWSNGADFLSADRTKVTVDDPKFSQALQFAADLSCKNGVAPTTQAQSSMSAWDMWLKGMVGMFVMGPWDQPTFWTLPFKWDIAPFPSSPATHKPAGWTGSMGFAVSAKSKHPKEAAELIRYFSMDEDGQRTNYQLGQAVPNVVSMAKGEFLKWDKAPAHAQVFLDNIETWGRPSLGWYTQTHEWMDQMFQNMAPVWECKQSAADWGKEWAPKLTATLQKSKTIPASLP